MRSSTFVGELDLPWAGPREKRHVQGADPSPVCCLHCAAISVLVCLVLLFYLVWIYGKRRFWRYFQTEEGRMKVVKFCAAFGYPPAVEEARRIRELERELKRATVEERRRQIELLFSEFKKLPHFEYKDHAAYGGVAEAPPPPAHTPSFSERGAADGVLATPPEHDHKTACTICMTE